MEKTIISLHDFIIENKNPFTDTFKTSSGLTLYLDVRFNKKETSNTIVKVISTPILRNTIIKKGYDVVIDPSIYNGQSYVLTGDQDSPNLKDKEKGLYSISEDLIVLYRESEEEEWKCNGEKAILKPIKEKNKEFISDSGIIMPETESKIIKNKAEVVYINQLLSNQCIKKGDIILIDERFSIPIYINGEEFYWVRNQDIYAIF